MLYLIKIREGSENLGKLVSLQIQVKALELQGKRNFHGDIKKVFERILKSNQDVSQDVTRTMIENSKENNKALSDLKDNFRNDE